MYKIINRSYTKYVGRMRLGIHDPILRKLAMPSHLTPTGAISGGWLMSNMDIAGGIAAWKVANGRIYTVSCEKIDFKKPVSCGDLVSYYATVIGMTNSSVRIRVNVEANNVLDKDNIKVASGLFTYVAIDSNDNSRAIAFKP